MALTNKTRNILLALLSAILLSLAWYEPFSGLFLLVAFVPLLILENNLFVNNTKHGWLYYATTFLLWNIFTVWWIYKATLGGAIFAWIGNAAQMIIVFALFRWVKRVAGFYAGYTAFVVFWITWEWFYFDAEITWTWLTLGNGFAKDIKLVQWYEYTGTLGGSLWILTVNLLLFFIIQNKQKGIALLKQKATLISFVLLIALPITISLYKYYNYKETENPCNALILQPNIDPYSEKFGGMSIEQQNNIMLELAISNIDPKLDYIIAPETAMQGWHLESQLDSDFDVLKLQELLTLMPNTNFIIGAETYRVYQPGQKVSGTARKMNDIYYDVYNTALQINKNKTSIYHKKKLVVGAEMLPYQSKFKFISKLSINLGGTSGSLGSQVHKDIFVSADERLKIGPAICYESIYGEYCSKFVKQGASVIAVVTNDGWWGNTPGRNQHLHFARLRAVELRRSIIRSANTGISAFINQRGDILSQTAWWQRTVLKGSVNANNKLTFYASHGDFIGRASSFAFFALLILALMYTFKRRKNRN